MEKIKMVTDAEAAEMRVLAEDEVGRLEGAFSPADANRLLADRERTLGLLDDIWADLQALEGGVSHRVTVRLMDTIKEAGRGKD